MSDIDALMAEEELGRQTKVFLQTEVGKYLDGCTIQDVEAAKDALLEIDAYGFSDLQSLQSKISQLQQRSKVAIALRSYLNEAIVNGSNAQHQLAQEE